MAGSVPYIPLPQSQNHTQPVGLALSRHLRGKLRVLMAGHGRSTAVSHRSRRELLSIEECQTFFTPPGQKAHYYNELDMTATIGQEADLASQDFENADVLKLIYGVCNGYPDDTERVDGFLKSVLLRLIPKYFQHPLRPPPKSLAIRETWQSGPRLLTNTSSTATSAIQNHYARLLMIARDGGLEIDAPASRRKKTQRWTCKMTMYRVLTMKDLEPTKIPMEVSRGYGDTSTAARQDAAKNIINQLHNVN
ncbi:hypothetical protein TWF225_009771 [Orbilia oligospora]|nr:hypothetical protein TWF751_006610 [Orbilia oligospora]KAF3173495.1 hypothetical protein TWF225_009771 [Orbilia oligospora]KAF3257814.1 hypothetical protein TWF217_005918 [Orbilia oligospora]KAF3278035.1 hypothetical protein TWF132_001292 [Orbilia oligospora]